MSDLQLTDPDPTEEAALRVLLHRAVDDIEVPPYGSAAPTVVELDRPRSRRTPWLAAAAVLVLVAGGLAWWSSGQGDERIDAGPADRVDAIVDPIVGEQTGIWRLPTEASGFEPTQAFGVFETAPVLVAVDDVVAPTKLLAITTVGATIASLPGASPPTPFVDGTTMSVVRGADPSSPSWLEVTGAGNSGFLVFAYVGLSDEAVQDLAQSVIISVDRGGNLTDAQRVVDTIASLRAPAGLEPTWNADDPIFGLERRHLSILTLEAHEPGSDRGVTVGLRATGMPGPVAIEWRRVQMSLSERRGAAITAMTPRPDLGDGVVVYTESDGTAMVTVTTHDGVEITAGFTEFESGTQVMLTSSVQEQLGLVGTLRAVDRSEFETRIAAAGAIFVDHTVNDQDSNLGAGPSSLPGG